MQNVTFYIRRQYLHSKYSIFSYKSSNYSKESEPLLNTKILWLKLSFLLQFFVFSYARLWSKEAETCSVKINNYIYIRPPRWWLHLILVRRFEYVSDPERYTSGSVATGRASLAGKVKG
jgi:hypothetical protein